MKKNLNLGDFKFGPVLISAFSNFLSGLYHIIFELRRISDHPSVYLFFLASYVDSPAHLPLTYFSHSLK